MTQAEIDAVTLSLKVSVVAVALLMPAAIGVAWVLARTKFAAKAVLEALVTLPLVLPPVVTGYLLLVLLGRRGWLPTNLAFSWAGAALASAVVAFPLAVRSIRQAIEAVDPRLEDAARTLGASRWRRFMTITLPLALPGVITGSILAFARSLGEFGATVTFAGNIPGVTRTVPLAIYTAAQQPGGEAAATRLVVIACVLALASIVVSEFLGRRRA